MWYEMCNYCFYKVKKKKRKKSWGHDQTQPTNSCLQVQPRNYCAIATTDGNPYKAVFVTKPVLNVP